MDYKGGGELFTHLQKDGGRFEESKVRFYLCEIILALEYLHTHGIIYRCAIFSCFSSSPSIRKTECLSRNVLTGT